MTVRVLHVDDTLEIAVRRLVELDLPALPVVKTSKCSLLPYVHSSAA